MQVRSGTPFWRDDRFWRIFSQVLFVIFLVLVGWYFGSNMTKNLAKLGTPIGFGFLKIEAGFDIGETPIAFDASESYARAFLVGVVNTLRVALVGMVLTTLLGIVVGISRLSTNWLVNKVAFVYVEVLRNTPVLLQIFFWYFAVFLNLPKISEKIVLPGPLFLSNRGLWIPWFVGQDGAGTFAAVVIAALIAAIYLFRRQTRIKVETGRETRAVEIALGVAILVPLAGWFLFPAAPVSLSLPVAEGETTITGGSQLTPEFAAVLVALVVYTSAFIGEIVRAGIQAVSKGQVEAAKALGLRPGQSLRLVVFPQALRVIIPPLTSQYLNLTKNSSLAIAVGYPDLFSIGSTVANQTGRSIEMITVIMLVYLAFSLVTSLFMNWYNRAVKLVER